MSDEKVTREVLLILARELGGIDANECNFKTAFWLSKNMRKLAPVAKAFEDLRTEITSTDIFKAYKAEIEAVQVTKESDFDTDSALAEINEKYKVAIADADAELAAWIKEEVDTPEWYKIAAGDVVGIPGEKAPLVYDMIE